MTSFTVPLILYLSVCLDEAAEGDLLARPLEHHEEEGGEEDLLLVREPARPRGHTCTQLTAVHLIMIN